MSTSEKVKGHLPIPSTWVFLGLAFALSWPILIYGFGWFSSEEDILKRYLLSCTGMLAIAFSALITRIFIERRGFQEAGWNPGHYKWYVGILGFNLLLWLAPPLAALIFGNLDFNEHPTQDQLVVVFLSLGGFSLLAGFGEEFGWRGYLLPRLLQNTRYTRGVLFVIGLIWGIWHCAVEIGPFIAASINHTGNPSAMLIPTFLNCLRGIGTSLVLSVIFGALWLKTRSVLLTSFFHGCWIGIRDSVYILLSYPALFQLITLLPILVTWFFCDRWLKIYGKYDNLS